MGCNRYIKEVGLLIAILLTISLVFAVSFHTTRTYSSGVEDQFPIFSYNLSANTTNSEGDTLTYSIEEIKSNSHLGTNATNFPWISLNSSTGILKINSTRNNETGIFNISITVLNTIPEGMTSVFYFEINNTNDAPYFSGLNNETFNMTDRFERIVYVQDEESNTPYVLNISFLNCTLAEWSTRGGDCRLFNESMYTFNNITGELNISFSASRNDVGFYLINFSVTDLNNEIRPYNQTTSKIINYTVLNVNSYPWFTYLCDNNRTTSEDSSFSCYINASDIDEINNLTFASNYTWFLGSTIASHNLSTDFKSYVLINFTPSDVNVGNWSININITDTGIPARTNSTNFYFFIKNLNDSVSLDSIQNLTAYAGNIYSILLNASDDDFLILDKSVYNESLNFSFVNSSGGVPSWLSLVSGSQNGNRSTSYLTFTASSEIGGGHIINVTVRDRNGFSSNSKIFNITVIANEAPYWNNLSSNFFENESEEFYLNLSNYVIDLDGDNLTFSFSNLSYFPSFSITENGIINFTPNDFDIGFHQIYFNVSDGKTPNSTLVEFNITNLNDVPFIEIPLTVVNASRDANSNISAVEDNVTIITLWVQDDDFKIKSNQKSFYNESITINVSIAGPNSTIITFVLDNDFPSPTFPNKTKYIATFTPKKNDIGNYNISINATDLGGLSAFLRFNLTISSINHNPELTNLTNQTSSINKNFYYKLNVSDIENGNNQVQNTNLSFSYNFLYGVSFLNSSNFNSTTGEINITFNESQYGSYRINITVNDSENAKDYGTFWVFVYENPSIFLPNESFQFNLKENQNSNLTFNVNHSVGDNLTYHFYIDGGLRYNISYYGNATNLTWRFTPNYTDETYNQTKNLTLLVINQVYPYVNSTENWNITINHTNYLPTFQGHIGDKQATTDQNIIINLFDYFYDEDYFDEDYNQTVNFTFVSNATSSYIISSEASGVLTLSALIPLKEMVNVSASDGFGNVSSNTFLVEFTSPPVQTVIASVSSGGGGGSSSTSKPVAFKLIVPDPVSAYRKGKIVLPLKFRNTGTTGFSEIKITGSVSRDGVERKDITTSFNKNEISNLLPGKEEEIIMTIITDTDQPGLFEVNINATSKNPKYSDWGKLYLTVKETDQIQEKFLFTEEFIAENPECVELSELVKEAKKLMEGGNLTGANKKIGEAIDACKDSISQQNLPRSRSSIEDNVYRYLTLVSLTVFFMGVCYYSYRRMKLKRAIIG